MPAQNAPLPFIDEAMDEALVNLTSQVLNERLRQARGAGRYGWWNPQVCSLQGLQDKAVTSLERGHFEDALAFCAMINARAKIGG